MTKTGRATRQHKPSTSHSQIDDKMRRKRAIEEAYKRKAKLKYLIEKAPKDSSDFIGALAADGLTLFSDPKKGLCVRITDDNGKEHSYSLQKDLGIDMSIIPSIKLTPSGTSSSQVSKVAASQTQNNTAQSSPLKSRSGSSRTANIKDTPSGSNRNAENEIRDGKSRDDLDEEWRRNNEFKI